MSGDTAFLSTPRRSESRCSPLVPAVAVTGESVNSSGEVEPSASRTEVESLSENDRPCSSANASLMQLFWAPVSASPWTRTTVPDGSVMSSLMKTSCADASAAKPWIVWRAAALAALADASGVAIMRAATDAADSGAFSSSSSSSELSARSGITSSNCRSLMPARSDLSIARMRGGWLSRIEMMATVLVVATVLVLLRNASRNASTAASSAADAASASAVDVISSCAARTLMELPPAAADAGLVAGRSGPLAAAGVLSDEGTQSAGRGAPCW